MTPTPSNFTPATTLVRSPPHCMRSELTERGIDASKENADGRAAEDQSGSGVGAESSAGADKDKRA